MLAAYIAMKITKKQPPKKSISGQHDEQAEAYLHAGGDADALLHRERLSVRCRDRPPALRARGRNVAHLVAAVGAARSEP